ncbi:MAG: ABC transporter permease, partial [bacterium]
MILLEYTTAAIKSLYVNKIRSFLSMLGIIIGVSNVILTIGILEGGRLLILNELGSLSSSLIYLYSSPYSEEFEYISQEEIAQIKMMPQVKEVLPEGFIIF